MLGITPTVQHASVQLLEALTIKQIHASQQKAIDALSAKVGTLFMQQARAVVKGLRSLSAYYSESLNDDFTEQFDKAVLDTSAKMYDALEKVHKVHVLAGGVAVYTQFNVKTVFTLKNPRAVSYLQDSAGNAITAIDDTTREIIRTIIVAGASNGLAYTDVAQQILARYAQMSAAVPQGHIRNRAQLIAITEIGQAYTSGNWIAAQSLRTAGLNMQKQWLTVGDRKVSEGCKINAAQGWIDINEDHTSGHKYPLRFPGCRCVEVYRRKKA